MMTRIKNWWNKPYTRKDMFKEGIIAAVGGIIISYVGLICLGLWTSRNDDKEQAKKQDEEINEKYDEIEKKFDVSSITLERD